MLLHPVDGGGAADARDLAVEPRPRLGPGIDFGPDNPRQPLHLHHYTREKGVAAGTTEWAGRQFGVQAFKTADKAAWRTFELAGAGSFSRGSGMAAVSRVPNSMELWWTGANGSVEGAYWYDGGQWQRYEMAPEGSACREVISAVSRVPNSMEFVDRW